MAASSIQSSVLTIGDYGLTLKPALPWLEINIAEFLGNILCEPRTAHYYLHFSVLATVQSSFLTITLFRKTLKQAHAFVNLQSFSNSKLASMDESPFLTISNYSLTLKPEFPWLEINPMLETKLRSLSAIWCTSSSAVADVPPIPASDSSPVHNYLLIYFIDRLIIIEKSPLSFHLMGL